MSAIGFQDVMGFAAGVTTLVAFAQKATVPMQSAAAVSNLFFIAYGALGALYPPLIFHCILLPLNLVQLVKEVRRARRLGRLGRVPKMIDIEVNFEAIFCVPSTHRLVAVRSRSRAGLVTGTFWDHEEYDEMGRLVARYASFEETNPHNRARRSGWRKYDIVGRLIAEGELPAV